MSAEVTKKRGRPKKVISDPVDVDLPETTKKASTRAKSTKAAPTRPVKATATPVTAKHIPAAKTVSTPTTPLKSAPKQSSSSSQVNSKEVARPTANQQAKTVPKSPVTPETSKILQHIRDLPSKPTASAPLSSAKSSKPNFATSPSRPLPSTQSKPDPTPPPTLASTKPPNASILPPPPTKPVPKIPIAALNSQIVSNISSRAGARPNTNASTKGLPSNYKPVARKVTMAIVALPIAIVTSYVLYQRLVLGEDRKYLVKPGMTMVDSLGGDEAGVSDIGSSPNQEA